MIYNDRPSERPSQGTDLINSPLKLWDVVLARLGYRGADELNWRLTKNTLGTLGTSVAAAGLAFITSMLLARVLGATGFGRYAYAVAVVEMLTIAAALGLGRLLVRNVAAYETRSAWGWLSRSRVARVRLGPPALRGRSRPAERGSGSRVPLRCRPCVLARVRGDSERTMRHESTIVYQCSDAG